MNDIKFRYRLQLNIDWFGKYKLGDIETFYMDIESLERFPIDSKWTILSRDLYTGFKEIYEGDITKAGDLICVIEFKGCKFVAKWEGKRGGHRYPDLMFKSHEVIGNIHENPELLNPNA
jgi:hypothetical protein